MATAVKRKLSDSTDGLPIKISATGSVGTSIHTAVAGTTAGTFDEIWVYGQNNYTSSNVSVTIEYGSADAPGGNIIASLPAVSGLQLLVPGLILQNSKTVKAFASVADVVSLSGFVNSVTD